MPYTDLLPLDTEKQFGALIPKLNKLFYEITGFDPDDPDKEPGQSVKELRDEIMGLLDGIKAYDQAGHFRGAPDGEEIIYYYVGNSVRRSNFPENFVGSVARCVVAPTATTVFKVYRNDTQVGTITFSAGVRSATFASIGAFTVGDGDTLSIEAPDPADATFETLIFNLKAEWSL